MELLSGLFCTVANFIPNDIQRAITHASRERPLSPEIKMELHRAMNTPFTYQEFEHCRRHLSVGKSPGPSGLTTTQIKHWGPDTSRAVFDLSNLMWQHHHVPEWWQDRLMTLLPKEPGNHDLNKIRPISLFEVMRKMWAGMVTIRIQRIWHLHKLLHPR